MIALALCLRSLPGADAPPVPQPPRIPAAAEFRQRVFARDNGLPDNRVLSLLQSRDGYLWIGTASGVARFDGSKFLIFGPDTHPEFVNDECAALAEGVDGSIWIGTEDGLLCLRGKKIQRFTEADGLVNKRIISLSAARNGDVWIGTPEGLNRLRRGRMETMLPAANARPEQRAAAALYEDAAGSVWMLFDTVRRWEPQTDQLSEIRFPEIPFPCDDSIRCITGDRQTNVWLKGGGLFHWRQGKLSYLFHLPSNPALALTRDGSVWFDRDASNDGPQKFDERGMFRYRDGTLEYYEAQDGISDNRVTALLEDRDGHLWIGTYSGGLNCWQPRRFATLGKNDGLTNAPVRALTPARDGGFWIGTDAGIHSSRAEVIRPFAGSTGFADQRIRALQETADGRLWVCSGSALEEWDGARCTSHHWLRQPAGDKYRTVFADRAGVIWLGGESGLMRRQNGEWRQFTTAEGLPHNDVYVLCEDPAGRLWLGTYGGGVCWWSGDTNLLTLNTTHGLSHDEVRALHADAEGFLWVGTERGLNRIDLRNLPTERRSPIRREPGSESQRVGSETGAPSSLRPPIHSFTRRDGLYDDLVSEILEDDFGNLWITCSRGLYRVSKRELRELAARRDSLGAPASMPARAENSTAKQTGKDAGAVGLHCIVYDEGDGLLSTDISGQKSRPAGCKTPDGRLWFPNAKGVLSVDPRRVIESDLPPPVVIEHFLVDGEDCAGKDFSPPPGPVVSAPSSVRNGGGGRGEGALHSRAYASSIPLALAPGRARSIEIQYTAPNFRAPERLQFRYRLDGWEQNWVDAGTRRVALYTNLKPGTYRFQVQAASNVGLWNETGDVLAFAIAPHIYETAWFWPATIVLALVLVGFAVEWRLREVRRMADLARRTALATERERIARDMHDDLGAGLTRLVLLGDAANRAGDGGAQMLLGRIKGEAGALVDQLGDLIWCTNHRFDSLDNLVAHLREHAAKFLTDAGLSLRFEPVADLPPLPVNGYFRRQTLLILKEVLNNIVRHAGATEVHVSLRIATPGPDGKATLELVLADNGRGFDLESPTPGHGFGLANLRSRTAALQGQIEIQSAPTCGTTVRVALPLSPHFAGRAKVRPDQSSAKEME